MRALLVPIVLSALSACPSNSPPPGEEGEGEEGEGEEGEGEGEGESSPGVCPIETFGTADGCDCGCDDPDPDCSAETQCIAAWPNDNVECGEVSALDVDLSSLIDLEVDGDGGALLITRLGPQLSLTRIDANGDAAGPEPLPMSGTVAIAATATGTAALYSASSEVDDELALNVAFGPAFDTPIAIGTFVHLGLQHFDLVATGDSFFGAYLVNNNDADGTLELRGFSIDPSTGDVNDEQVAVGTFSALGANPLRIAPGPAEAIFVSVDSVGFDRAAPGAPWVRRELPFREIDDNDLLTDATADRHGQLAMVGLGEGQGFSLAVVASTGENRVEIAQTEECGIATPVVTTTPYGHLIVVAPIQDCLVDSLESTDLRAVVLDRSGVRITSATVGSTSSRVFDTVARFSPTSHRLFIAYAANGGVSLRSVHCGGDES